MTPHGPDAATFEASVAGAEPGPAHLPADTLAFMFETHWTPRVTMSVRLLSFDDTRNFAEQRPPAQQSNAGSHPLGAICLRRGT